MKRVLADWVRPLQDLLVVSLGRPVSIIHLAVRPQGSQRGRRCWTSPASWSSGLPPPLPEPLTSAATTRPRS
jgi:hypothetical protein